jgi:hypothetical protein
MAGLFMVVVLGCKYTKNIPSAAQKLPVGIEAGACHRQGFR